jgi:uncharacterized Zn finger protein
MYSLPQTILAKVDGARLQKGVDGLISGAYVVSLTSQSATELRGFVHNGDATEYGVVLSEGRAYCNCPDAMYRKTVCKHAVILALHVIRAPQAEAKAVVSC